MIVEGTEITFLAAVVDFGVKATLQVVASSFFVVELIVSGLLVEVGVVVLV